MPWGIHQLHVIGENLSADVHSIEPFIEKLHKLMEEKELQLRTTVQCRRDRPFLAGITEGDAGKRAGEGGTRSEVVEG